MGIGNKIKKAKKKQGRLNIICEATGWSAGKAASEMDKAVSFGVNNYNYIARHAYDLNESELKELGQVLEIVGSQKNVDRDYYADIVCMRTGWDKVRALAEIDKAYEMGITALGYVQKGCWNFNDEQLRSMTAEESANKSRIAGAKEDYISRIMRETGWPYGKVELEVYKARASQGASYEDFFRFRFFEKTEEERLKYPTLRVMDKFRLKYCSFEPRARYFDDKAEFNRTFSDYVKRVWFTNDNLSYEDFLCKIRPLDKVLVKPITDSCGNGISVHGCNVSEEENRRLYELIMATENTLVEEYIVQHEDMMRLCDTSVNTVRINTMQWQGECIFQFAIVRTGCGGIVDNFHNGGIAARVDLETGVINADATDLDGNIFEENPYSGIKFRGYQIPHWNKIMDACRDMSGRVKDMAYIGWDFAITPEGIDLIEGNEGAYVMPQMCNLQDNIGLRPVLCDPYI